MAAPTEPANALARHAASDPDLHVCMLPHNRGKGAAILHGLAHACAHGITHVVTLDADGQHAADDIAMLVDPVRTAPDAMVLGMPDVRCKRAVDPRRRPPGFQILGKPGDPAIGHRQSAVRLPGLSDRAAAAGLRGNPLDAALRFRLRGGDQAVLAGRRRDQCADAGALLPPRGRRRIAFPLSARQSLAGVHVPAADRSAAAAPASLLARRFKSCRR